MLIYVLSTIQKDKSTINDEIQETQTDKLLGKTK